MKKYQGREWMWWVVTNAHVCCFCRMELMSKGVLSEQQLKDMRLVIQTGMGQYQDGYRSKLHSVWLRHMKQYHPEIVAGARSTK